MFSFEDLLVATFPPAWLVERLAPQLFPSTLPAILITKLVGIIWFVVLGAAAWFLIALLMPKWLHHPVAFAWVLWWYPYMVLLLPSCVLGVWTCMGDIHQRWYGENIYTDAFLILYISSQFLGLIKEILWEPGSNFGMKKMLIFLHHVISGGCFVFAIYMGRLHFWACFCGLCEITNVPLNILTIAKWKGLRARFESNPFLVFICAFNGVLLWLGFLLLRVVLFPIFLWCFAYDCFYPGLGEHPCQDVTWVELIMYPFIATLIWALSVYWFILIHKGMLKALGYGPKQAQKKEE
eukprot:gb/GEZN01009119.1/.p1 GENE.gb/GEZN01009119.1/~~gb/GEZN01009119.1/.p1  ORF type:complete len:302 (-),score=28.87 gb/GEZN01009119.1/:451-1332(-)